MATVQDINNEIDRIEIAKSGIIDAIHDKGVDVPENTPIQGLPALIRLIPSGDSKNGIISQTQNWTGSENTGYDYTMTEPVYGNIPQSNIDLFASVGAVFNETSGYFEMNGITDISYNEMLAIYSKSNLAYAGAVYGGSFFRNFTGIRTNCPISNDAAVDFRYSFYYSRDFEVAGIKEILNVSQSGNMFNECNRLRGITGVFSFANANATTNAFRHCYTLESLQINALQANISFSDCPRLNLASVVYMVEHSRNSSAITITLNATAYLRCQADETQYRYSGNTYTGIIAYAAAKNITIASA